MKRLKRIVVVFLIILGTVLVCITSIPGIKEQIQIAIQFRHLSSSDEIKRWDAKMRLSEMGLPSITQIITWATWSKNKEVREEAINLLAQISIQAKVRYDLDIIENIFKKNTEQKVKQVLFNLLENNELKVKSYAACVLAMMGEDDRRILPILMDAFKSNFEEIWYPSGEVLSYIHICEAKVIDEEYVKKIVLEEEDRQRSDLYAKRSVAASILGNTGTDESLDLLIETFGEIPHGLPELINAGNIKALEQWRKGLTAQDKSTRNKAFGAILGLRTTSVIEDIVSLLRDDFPGYEGLSEKEVSLVKRRCLWALESIAKFGRK